MQIAYTSTPMRPSGQPLGRRLALTAKTVARAFDDELTAAGGSLPVWLVLSSLRAEPRRTQQELAGAVGVEGPTLTRHLDGLEEAGLVVRKRDAQDRRAVQVELTDAGRALHAQLLKAVIAFNKRLLAGFGQDEVAKLGAQLERLEQNARRNVD
jgi:MarR family transcriptional regulator, transcriptional regulator for hemolysin